MNNLVNDTIADLLEGRVKFKRNNTPDLRFRAKRIANRAPEVMVKISGHTKNSNHVLSHLHYISRNGKLELENERGEVLKSKTELKELHKEWSQDQGKRRAKTRQTTNIVLSMPSGTHFKAVKDAARDFARIQFSQNYQYVFGLHTDDDHPHVHLTVKNLGFDGRRLHVKKGDPQQWRELFAKQLQRQGVDAEATARATRGVVKKRVKGVIRQIHDRGLVPTVDDAKIREIIEDFNNQHKGQPARPKPWEDKIKARQTETRKNWLKVAKLLLQSPDIENQTLAKNIMDFVSTMPPLKTERHEIQERLAAQLNARTKTTQHSQDRGEDQAERE